MLHHAEDDPINPMPLSHIPAVFCFYTR
jgi:hypothetical protein